MKDKNILLVEDMQDNRLLMTRMLEKYEVRITSAVNGLEGVEKALSGNYDLILMDIQMPVMDGLQATQELRKNGYKKPIIALTAHAMKEDKIKCLEAGFTDYLTKPIQLSALTKILTDYIK